MIRSELVARIARQNPHLYEREVEAMVKAILDRITGALADGDRVELRGFGTFSPRGIKARASCNPRSGAAVEVPARRSIRFKTGKPMQARLNRVRVGPGPRGVARPRQSVS